jgi:superfamily II DNA or RNA helicase
MKKFNPYTHQINPIKSVENLNGIKVLGACPNSGKTLITVIGIKGYLKRNPGHRILVLAHNTNVIKANFVGTMKDWKHDIDYTWSTDLTDSSTLHVAIPSQENKIIQKYDCVVVDEAHENYLSGHDSKEQVKRIIERVGAKNQLLLTGTPSKFIKEGGYDIEFISLLDMDKSRMSHLGIELIETPYNFKSYYNRKGNVKEVAFDGSKVEDVMQMITLGILKKIKNNLSASEFNRLFAMSKLKSEFKKVITRLFMFELQRTMIVCGSIKQADDINKFLSDYISCEISHSESGDDDSSLFDDFRKDKFKVLIVVNRGRLGYSDNGLYNMIDISGTHNPDLIYQMFARVLRGNPRQKKMYYKVTTQEPGMRDLTYMATSAALMLSDKQYLSTYNGSNFNGIKIPVIMDDSNVTTIKSRGNKGDGVSNTTTSLKFPAFTNDIINFMRNVTKDESKKLQVYKMTTIAQVRQVLGKRSGCNKHFRLVDKDYIIELLKTGKYRNIKQWNSDPKDKYSYDVACQINKEEPGFMDLCKTFLPDSFTIWTKQNILDHLALANYETRKQWRNVSGSSLSSANNKFGRKFLVEECYPYLQQMPKLKTRQNSNERKKAILDWLDENQGLSPIEWQNMRRSDHSWANRSFRKRGGKSFLNQVNKRLSKPILLRLHKVYE